MTKSIYSLLTFNGINPQFDSRFQVGSDVTDPDAILVRSDKIDTNLFPRLSVVARAGAGTNNITVEQATKAGVCVMNTPGANANAVAELVFLVIAMVLRNILPALDFARSLDLLPTDDEIKKRIEDSKKQFRGRELKGKTLGVVGLGHIGRLVVKTGIALGMRVTGYDPVLNWNPIPAGFGYRDSVADVIRDADIFTVHVPFSDLTENLINAGILQYAKKGCILLNYSRAEIFDAGAVLKLLNEGQCRAYATDFPVKSLISHPNVVSTPHLGASTEESEALCLSMATSQVTNFLTLGTVVNSVNFPAAELALKGSANSRLVVVNEDRPGMIAEITALLAKLDFNIHGMINESGRGIGYNLIDFEDSVPDSLLGEIRRLEGILGVRAIEFS